MTKTRQDKVSCRVYFVGYFILCYYVEVVCDFKYDVGAILIVELWPKLIIIMTIV